VLLIGLKQRWIDSALSIDAGQLKHPSEERAQAALLTGTEFVYLPIHASFKRYRRSPHGVPDIGEVSGNIEIAGDKRR
jgi:hypothetical protein